VKVSMFKRHKYIIETDIGFFCKDSDTLVTQDRKRATRMDKTRVLLYFDSICSDIAMVNKKDIKCHVVKL
jgi:hypothetical protein